VLDARSFSVIQVDCLVVGAGFAGATIAERMAAERGRKVLVLERRRHIGGNAYDCNDDQGVLIHPYGPHIFHTNARQIWDYLSRFTEWLPYEHKVLAEIDGKQVPVPFNLNSLHALFPASQAAHLEHLLIEQFGAEARVPILKMRENAHADLQELADYVYHKIFLGYTTKQWGLRPEDLSPSVTARVPFAVSRDDRYFQDTYQAMPLHGYTAMFERMLNHPNIEVRLNTDFFALHNEIKAQHIFFTGPIDAYFEHRFGPLPYRSLQFEHENLAQAHFQAVGTVNYPNEHDYTRITEFKHITCQHAERTAIVREYPRAEGDPYYPVPRPDNEALYQRYQKLADAEKQVSFVGRLANYRYYNMDQVVASALTACNAIS
jgi:UDP-galactopyranose mutase